MDHHVDGETPLRRHRLDTRPPDFVTSLVQIRRLVETVRGQLTAQGHIATVRARDLWHFEAYPIVKTQKSQPEDRRL
jgi:hypothetical protein